MTVQRRHLASRSHSTAFPKLFRFKSTPKITSNIMACNAIVNVPTINVANMCLAKKKRQIDDMATTTIRRNPAPFSMNLDFSSREHPDSATARPVYGIDDSDRVLLSNVCFMDSPFYLKTSPLRKPSETGPTSNHCGCWRSVNDGCSLARSNHSLQLMCLSMASTFMRAVIHVPPMGYPMLDSSARQAANWINIGATPPPLVNPLRTPPENASLAHSLKIPPQ